MGIQILSVKIYDMSILKQCLSSTRTWKFWAFSWKFLEHYATVNKGQTFWSQQHGECVNCDITHLTLGSYSYRWWYIF